MRFAPPGRPHRATAPLGSVVALLAVRNLAELRLPDTAYVPTNVAAGAVLLALARRRGISWRDVGLERGQVRRALVIGGAVGATVMAAMVVGAVLPATRGLFDDGRVPREAGAWERIYQTGLRIPVGTVAFEELAFRGVLLAALARRFSPRAAVTIDSALFGLWHIVPTLGTARANDVVGLGRVGLVIASVAVTFVGGLVFCILRERSGHVLAPALVHLAFNDTGYLLAWWVRS